MKKYANVSNKNYAIFTYKIVVILNDYLMWFNNAKVRDRTI